jgi:hypothetical protein
LVGERATQSCGSHFVDAGRRTFRWGGSWSHDGPSAVLAVSRHSTHPRRAAKGLPPKGLAPGGAAAAWVATTPAAPHLLLEPLDDFCAGAVTDAGLA